MPKQNNDEGLEENMDALRRDRKELAIWRMRAVARLRFSAGIVAMVASTACAAGPGQGDPYEREPAETVELTEAEALRSEPAPEAVPEPLDNPPEPESATPVEPDEAPLEPDADINVEPEPEIEAPAPDPEPEPIIDDVEPELLEAGEACEVAFDCASQRCQVIECVNGACTFECAAPPMLAELTEPCRADDACSSGYCSPLMVGSRAIIGQCGGVPTFWHPCDWVGEVCS